MRRIRTTTLTAGALAPAGVAATCVAIAPAATAATQGCVVTNITTGEYESQGTIRTKAASSCIVDRTVQGIEDADEAARADRGAGAAYAACMAPVEAVREPLRISRRTAFQASEPPRPSTRATTSTVPGSSEARAHARHSGRSPRPVGRGDRRGPAGRTTRPAPRRAL
ncbi:hypothetical protein ACWCXB_25065 [Streptomyces sp. NPDC001514]